MRTRGEIAKENFLAGCNCAQSVLLAFSDETGLDRDTAMRLASSFGGGMGRLHEVCGTVSASMMILGLVHGYNADSPTEPEDKKAHYARVQELARRFREERGSIVCREILARHAEKKRGESGEDDQTRAMLSTDPTPTPRTPEYYSKRPCAALVEFAADLLDAYLEELKQESGNA